MMAYLMVFLQDELLNVCLHRNSRTRLIYYLCFEKYLLDSPFLNGVKIPEINGPVDELEKTYERVLSSVLPHGYSKGELPVCITEDCAVVKKSGYSRCVTCELCKYKSKRDLVVYGHLSYIQEVDNANNRV